MPYNVATIVFLIAIVFTMVAQAKVNSNFRRYSGIRNERGISGAEAARRVLDANGLRDVEIQQIAGNLTDHYDPRSRVLRLSQSVYGVDSIAAVSVACHEAGHAIQHAENYMPLRLRNGIVPVVNFVSYLGYFGLLISIIGGLTGYIKLSIIILLATVLFQLVTLPVEIDASKRALVQLEELNLVYNDENKSAKKVLSAAAMTYIASLLSSILDLLRLILILNSRNDDRR